MKDIINKRRLLVIAALVCLAVLVTFAAVTIAKYILDSKEASLGIVEGEDFIFYSTPDENTADTPHMVYDGEFNFTLKNYNELITTPSNIVYTIALSGGTGTIQVDGAPYEAAQTMTGGSQIEHNVAISGLANGQYTVTIQSSEPYVKSIVLYVTVEIPEVESYYKITKHDTWCELDIYTGSDASDITIEYMGAPDNTDSRMADWEKNSVGTLTNLEAYAHYKLVFYNVYYFELTQSETSLGHVGELAEDDDYFADIIGPDDENTMDWWKPIGYSETAGEGDSLTFKRVFSEFART